MITLWTSAHFDNSRGVDANSMLYDVQGTEKICLPYNPGKPGTVRSILSLFSRMHKIERAPKEIMTPSIQKVWLLCRLYRRSAPSIDWPHLHGYRTFSCWRSKKDRSTSSLGSYLLSRVRRQTTRCSATVSVAVIWSIDVGYEEFPGVWRLCVIIKLPNRFADTVWLLGNVLDTFYATDCLFFSTLVRVLRQKES